MGPGVERLSFQVRANITPFTFQIGQHIAGFFLTRQNAARIRQQGFNLCRGYAPTLFAVKPFALKVCLYLISESVWR